MARLHGRNMRLYAAVASGGTAEPIAFLNKWSISASTDDAEVTAFGDANKIYVAGLPDASGSFAGFYDDSTAQFYTAALDGVARKFYAYMDTSTPTANYFYGTALFDFTIDGEVAGGIAVSGSWKATSTITKKT